MASLDILCFNPFNLKNKIMKIEHKKIFRGPTKNFEKYLMTRIKTLRSPSLSLNVLVKKYNKIGLTIFLDFEKFYR